LMWIMMAKVWLGQFVSSPIEGIFILHALGMVVPCGVQWLDSRCLGVRKLKLISLVKGVSLYPRFHFCLKSWLSVRGRGWTLGRRSHHFLLLWIIINLFDKGSYLILILNKR
jgi:hypothetical protein